MLPAHSYEISVFYPPLGHPCDGKATQREGKLLQKVISVNANGKKAKGLFLLSIPYIESKHCKLLQAPSTEEGKDRIEII